MWSAGIIALIFAIKVKKNCRSFMCQIDTSVFNVNLNWLIIYDTEQTALLCAASIC